MKMSKKSIILLGGALCFLVLLLTAGVHYSDTPQMCRMCHSMEPYYVSLQQNQNHKALTCGTCHAPKQYISKVSFKLTSGIRDLYATAVGIKPTEATPKSMEIINKNCFNCHESMISATHEGRKGYCTDCHTNIPHGGS